MRPDFLIWKRLSVKSRLISIPRKNSLFSLSAFFLCFKPPPTLGVGLSFYMQLPGINLVVLKVYDLFNH